MKIYFVNSLKMYNFAVANRLLGLPRESAFSLYPSVWNLDTFTMQLSRIMEEECPLGMYCRFYRYTPSGVYSEPHIYLIATQGVQALTLKIGQ